MSRNTDPSNLENDSTTAVDVRQFLVELTSDIGEVEFISMDPEVWSSSSSLTNTSWSLTSEYSDVQ